MMGLAQFAQMMKQQAAALPSNVNKQVIKLAGSILQTLVLATPVDTGRARSEWQVSLGEPIEDEVGSIRSPQQTIDDGKEVLKDRQPNGTIYIANNVPYIQRLNEGWSAQAPAGFIEKAINVSANAFKDIKVVI